MRKGQGGRLPQSKGSQKCPRSLGPPAELCVPPWYRGAGLSESEAEPDGEHNITELPQAIAGRGNMRAQQSAVRLTEVRPSG